MVMHQFTLHRDWCITHMANTANTASVKVVNQGLLHATREKKKTYTCNKETENVHSLNVLSFFPNLSSAIHSLSNHSVHIKI